MKSVEVYDERLRNGTRVTAMEHARVYKEYDESVHVGMSFL